jgi:3-oxoacyl-(acyl-carrier-protein) synthase
MEQTVITGIGLISPGSCKATDVWNSLLSKTDLFERIPIGSSDSITVGKLPVYDVNNYPEIEKKKFRYLDKQVLYCLMASIEAVRDSGLDELFKSGKSLERIGSVMGSMTAQMEFGVDQLITTANEGPHRISRMTGVAFYFGASVGEISVMYKTQGENCSVLSGSSVTMDGLMLAADMIKRGNNDAIMVGAGENVFFEVFYNGFTHYNKLSRRKYLPYDRNRQGCFLTNGGGVYTVERASHALKRNAPIYAEVASYHSLNSNCIFGFNSKLTEYTEKVIHKCLSDANMTPGDIDLILPTADGSWDGDYYEMIALKNVFGDRRQIVYTPKPVIGHCLSFNTVVDTFVGIMSMKEGIIPGHLEQICSGDDEFDVMLVGDCSIRRKVENVMLLHRNFIDGKIGGIIIKKFQNRVA